MPGTTPQGRTSAVRPSPAHRKNSIRTYTLAVVAQLAVLTALAGCGLTLRGGYAAPTTRLPNIYPTYAPGPTPQPARSNQTAPNDAVDGLAPQVEEVFWIPKYPESERRGALPGWLDEYSHHWNHSAIAGRPAMGRLTHFPDQ